MNLCIIVAPFYILSCTIHSQRFLPEKTQDRALGKLFGDHRAPGPGLCKVFPRTFHAVQWFYGHHLRP